MIGTCTLNDGDDGLSFGLNMDHPEFQKAMRLGLHLKEAFPGSVVVKIVDRVNRRHWFNSAMERIGSLSSFRRKLVVRELVRMYAKGRMNAAVVAAISDGIDQRQDKL